MISTSFLFCFCFMSWTCKLFYAIKVIPIIDYLYWKSSNQKFLLLLESRIQSKNQTFDRLYVLPNLQKETIALIKSYAFLRKCIYFYSYLLNFIMFHPIFHPTVFPFLQTSSTIILLANFSISLVPHLQFQEITSTFSQLRQILGSSVPNEISPERSKVLFPFVCPNCCIGRDAGHVRRRSSAAEPH